MTVLCVHRVKNLDLDTILHFIDFFFLRVLPGKYFCPFSIKTFDVSLSNNFTVFGLSNTLLTLCLLIAVVWLCRKSDGSHLCKLITWKVWELDFGSYSKSRNCSTN